MKNPEWYNDIWRKKLDELPVNDDPSSAWQQMQQMLDEMPSTGSGVPKPGLHGVRLFKVISYIAVAAVLTAAIVYKAVDKRDNSAGQASSVKTKRAADKSESRSDLISSAHDGQKVNMEGKNNATVSNARENTNPPVNAAKTSGEERTHTDSSGISAGNTAISKTSDKLSHNTSEAANRNSDDEIRNKTNNVNSEPKYKASKYKENGKGNNKADVIATNITHRLKHLSKPDKVKYKADQSAYAIYSNQGKYKSGQAAFSGKSNPVTYQSDRDVSAQSNMLRYHQPHGFASIRGRDSLILSVSPSTGKSLSADETAYRVLVEQNSARTLRTTLATKAGNEENGDGFSKIDMTARGNSGGNSAAVKGKKTGGEKYPKPKKRTIIKTPKYNYGIYAGLSDGTTNSSANIGFFGAYALSNRWLINTGIYLNASRSFSGSYTHQSFYRPDSLPSFTINDYRKAVAVNIPVRLEYKVMNLLSIKAGPLISFTASQGIAGTSYSTIKDRRDTLRHGTELNTALNGTKVSRIVPGFEAGLSFHLWKLDIDGQYQWLAPYTISGTLGSYRNKYHSVNVGIGYRFK